MSVGGWGWGVETLSGLWPGRVSGWGWGCDMESVHSDTVGGGGGGGGLWPGESSVDGANKRPTYSPHPPTHTHSPLGQYDLDRVCTSYLFQ